jgi:hypothetical protein
MLEETNYFFGELIAKGGPIGQHIVGIRGMRIRMRTRL